MARYLGFFPTTLILIFGLFLSRLGYCTRFFSRCSPIFCTQQHMVVRLTQFPVFYANNSHHSTRVASRWCATVAWGILLHFSDDWITVFFSVWAVNFPRFVVARACFWTRLLHSSKPGGYFSHWHLLGQLCCQYFFYDSQRICFP